MIIAIFARSFSPQNLYLQDYKIFMKRIVLLLFSFFLLISVNAQTKPPLKQVEGGGNFNLSQNDSLNKNTSNKDIKNADAKIEMYKIISRNNDTTFVDTTLTIYNEYKFNYFR